MTDYVAIGFDVAGYVRAFTTGTLNACKAAARTYKRKKNGMRVYSVVKVMTWEELQLITGHKWDTTTIKGCCQSDWQTVYYDVEKWSREELDHFETMYFNTGSEWVIHDEETEPESPEDISGYSVYCISWNDEGIKKELAEAAGVEPEEIIMYAYDHSVSVPVYRIA